MLLTKQQKFLLAALEKLGCAELRQLAALLQKTFAFSSIDDAVRVTNACVRQMQMGGLLQISDNIVSHCGERAVSQQIEAIDVMLELSENVPISFTAEQPPILLRFSVQQNRVHTFAVVKSSQSLLLVNFQPLEKVVILLSQDERPMNLPIGNQQIFAIRQEDRSFRFFIPK